MILPKNFIRTIIDVFEEEGKEWLKQLPALITEFSERWGLTVDQPFALSYNYVAPAVREDGAHVVLKMGVPEGEIQDQIEALQHYDGRGSVRLLEGDRAKGAMLLERLEPGTTLVGLSIENDEKATSAAALVMRQLWRPLPEEHYAFPKTVEWADGFKKLRVQFDGGCGPLPCALVEKAERLFAELHASTAEQVLLHGDLHHENILASERQPWLAIDPKGIIGEPAYEVGALLRNPNLQQLLAKPNARQILARRLDQFAEELQIDRARLRDWGIAQAVLSAWWSVEDHGQGWEPAIACAELLAGI